MVLDALQILPWIMEIGGIVGVIIGLAQWEAKSVDKECKKNNKVKQKCPEQFGYPEHWMVLLTLMISMYNVAMQLKQTGWWWSIKHRPPDPFSLMTGSE